jgi:anti-anti-sigma factor
MDVQVGTLRELVELAGSLDVTTAPDVRLLLHAAIDHAAVGDGDVVVDLHAVEMVDATGLGVLVGAHRRAGRAGLRLVLRGVPPRIDRLLQLTRLHRVLPVEAAA